MISTLIVVLLLSCTASALSVHCEVPDMSEFAPEVVFTCTFSEAVRIYRPERVFVPNFVSISPKDGVSQQFSITASVTDNTKGEMTLLLGEGAFVAGEVLSEEYSTTVSYDFIYENVNVVGVIDVLSNKPDFAMVRITGGQTVLQQVENIEEIAIFPPCMTVLKVSSTINAYEVSVYVNDPAKVHESTFRVKSGVIRNYWGLRMNIEKDVSFTVETDLTATSTIEFWPASKTLYTSNGEFTYDISALFENNCMVDETSFSTANVRVLSTADFTLTGILVNPELPGSISFLGYLPNTCTAANYPVEATAMVVKVDVPTYTISHEITSPGCAAVNVKFSGPVTALSDDLLVVESVNNLPFELDVMAETLDYDTFTYIYGQLCVGGDSDTFIVNVSANVIALTGDELQPVNEEIYISKVAMVLLLDEATLPAATHNETYIAREKTFEIAFNVLGSNPIGSCDFSEAFSADYLVDWSYGIINNLVTLTLTANSIDHHVVRFDASKVRCDGAFAVQFFPEEFKFAYDPAFLPGDIVITRVNSYYSPEFDFVPLRKVFTWNRVFFTDAGWVNEVYGFIDHGSDGYISWTPKTDVEAGTVQHWSYVAMTQSLDRSIPKEVETDYSFNYEMHGFLLDFQDNLFIYVTGNGDAASVYDDYNHITFIFGIYWSSSEWANQTYDYMDITAEYSSLPLQLAGYNIALGSQATPVPRGVNYMAIKQSNFNTFSNSYYHMIEKIINKDNWVTSQKDRFNTAPLVSYIERPMDFVVNTDVFSYESHFCFRFATPYTVYYNSEKIALTFDGNAHYWFMRYMNGEYCITFYRPTTQGIVKLAMEKGAFTYTTTSTLSPFTFESVAFQTSEMIYNTPSISITRSNAPYQFIELTSSIECTHWNNPTFINAEARLVSRSETKSVYAVMFTGNFDMHLQSGVCTTEGNLASSTVDTYTTYYYPPEPVDALLEDVHFIHMKANSPVNTVYLKYPSGWYLDYSVMPTLGGHEATSVDLYSNRVAVITFDESVTSGNLVIPSGLFYSGVQRSVGVHSLSFDFNNTPVDVIAKMNMPWVEMDITKESAHEAYFTIDFAPGVGSASPRELVFFENSCKTLGYVMGPSVVTSVTLAVMHGECNYGINADMIFDSYGNTNAGFEGSVSFDFLPPVGTIFLAEDAQYVPASTDREFWNFVPVIGVAFDEVVYDMEEEPYLLEADNGVLVLDSVAIQEDRTVIRYLLVNSTEGQVVISRVEDIELKDALNNTCISKDCILRSELTFEIDTIVPTVTLSTDSKIIYGDTIDIHYELSEEMTTFSCASIAFAVSEVMVEVSELEGHICHYAFTPKPLNGTYLVFSVPANRFMDKALSSNPASNTLTVLVFNEGAKIIVTAPEYTNTVQTEFSVSIEYSWLCPNYELIFPSTFEYDRNVARIEKSGESVVVDGVVTQSFIITFFNFETYPEERYKNMPIYIPSKVCSTSYGLYNDATSFTMSFDNTPTVPTFEMNSDGMSEHYFVTKVTFEDMKEFGSMEASDYFHVMYEDESPIYCVYDRFSDETTFSYIAYCNLLATGNLNITIHRGAVIENTGVPSSSFTRILFVDANPPTITLAAVDENITFGPAVTSLPIQMTVSEIMGTLYPSCFAFEDDYDLTVSVTVDYSPVTSNQIVTLNMINTHLYYGRTSGSFNVYVRAGCLNDIHNNPNIRSNKLTFFFDYTSPSVELTCPTENIVLNTITFSGEASEPIQDLTPENIQIPSSCSVRDITMMTSTSFQVTASCYDTGVFNYRVVGVKDLVGNIGSPSNRCSTSFTIYGPTIQYTIQNLVKEEYVNTDRFVIELSAAPNCYSMNLTANSFVTENVKNIVTTQLSACTWTLSGENIEEGLVVIRILEGAAVDVYGGPSLSRFIEFRSYQSRPVIVGVNPSLVVANSKNDITICYDRALTRGAGNVLAEGACSNAVITSMSNYCMNVNVEITVGSRCYLHLEEDVVSTAWELSSAARYVFLEIDNQPPTIDVTMKVDGSEVTSQVNPSVTSTKTFYVNKNGMLEIHVPANVEMALQKLDYTTPSCINSIEVEQKTDLEIAIAFKEVNACMMTFNFAAGFFVDAFGRSSEPLEVNVDFNKVAATASFNVAASSVAPVAQSVDFSKNVKMTEENVISEIPFTVSMVNEKKFTIEFTPEAEGEYTVDFKDVKDIYGNDVAMQTVTYFYYTTQPTAVVEEIVVVSTQLATPFELTHTFNHRMASLPTQIAELYQCNTPLKEFFNLAAATLNDMTATIALTPKAVEVEYKEIICSLSSEGFVDLAGNTIAPTSFTLIIDNQPPRIESITHNGGSEFSVLPVAITINFNKMITLKDDFASKIRGRIGETDLMFAQQQRSVAGVNQITLVSLPVDYQPVAGDKLSIVVDGDFAMDGNNLTTASFETEFTVTSGSIEIEAINAIPGEYAFEVIMTRPVSTVLLANIDTETVVFESMSIEDKKIHIAYTCSEQGPFNVTFTSGSIVAADDSTNNMEMTFSGLYDTVAPSVFCTVPEIVGASAVSIPCEFNEPVETTSTFFTVERGDIILNTQETISEDGKTVTLTFTPMESVIPDYTDEIVISMNNCHDINMNACLPVRYQTVIDFTRPAAVLEVSRQYIKANETIDVYLTFSKTIVTEIVAEDLVFVYPEDIAFVTVDSFEVVEPGMQYKWTASFITNDFSNELIPFALVFSEGLVVDIYGNGNKEAAAVVYIHEAAPVIDYEVFGVDDENKQLTLSVSVTNGPISAFTSSMLSLSDNIEMTEAVAVENVDTNSVYHLTFQLNCAATCEFSIRFLSEMIFNLAGNQLEHDVAFNTVYIMSPEVVLSTESEYCSESFCMFSVHTSERVDIDCTKIPIASEHFSVIAGECYNDVECQCTIEALNPEISTAIDIQVPAGLFKTAYNAENMESGILTIYYSNVRPQPVFVTEWTEEESIKYIPFVVTPNVPDTILLPSMVKCFNCEISGWHQLETSPVAMYAFFVSFISETDNYIRVYMEDSVFEDPFGHYNNPAEYVLRKQSEIPVATKLTYSPGRTSKISVEFSLPIQACEGMIVLTPEDAPAFTYYINSQDPVIQYNGKTMTLLANLLPQTKYTINWEYAALCDETKQPASTECPMCEFATIGGVAAPPLYLAAFNYTANSAVIEYSEVHTGGLPLRAIIVYTVPATSSKPFVYETEETEGLFVLEGLESNTKYKVYLASYTDAGISILSTPVDVETEATVPEPVSHIRICSIENPIEANGLISYSDAVVCWNASPSKDVRYKVTVTELVNGNPARKFTAYKGKKLSAPFSVSNDIDRYIITVTTISLFEVLDGDDRISVNETFDTVIDLENVDKYPQGAGIEIAAERVSGNSVYIRFNHPYENYFAIEKYLVQYGNTFDDTFIATGEELESYPFKMEHCLGNYVTVTVRAGVKGDFWGVPSNRVIVYCNKPRLTLHADAGYNFVTFTAASDVNAKAVCALKGKYDVAVMEKMEITVDANKPATSYLFKSLNPDTDYKIECEGYDIEYNPVSGSIEFFTTANFETPAMEVAEIENVHANYVSIPIETVNMPGTVYCVAKPIEEPIELSRVQFIKQGASTYMFPGSMNKEVIVSGLKPATEYHAKCFFDADYSASMIIRQRRLVDEEVTFVTPFVSSSEWTHVYPAGSVVVPLYQPIILTAPVPITLHHGRVVIRCLTDKSLTQRINNEAGLIHVEGNTAKVYLKRPLSPGHEYRVEVTLGLFLDEAGYPMAALTAQDNYVFIATSDERMISEPVLIHTSPEFGSVTDLVSMKIHFTFDREIVVGSGVYTVKVNDEAPIVMDASTLEVSNSILTINNNLFLKPNSKVRVVLRKNAICTRFLVCNSERIVLRFTVGDHAFDPSLVSMFPVDGQTDIPAGEDLKFTFNKEIVLGDDFVMTFTDENENTLVLKYMDEKPKLTAYLSVVDNQIIVKGAFLPAGHKYFVLLNSEAIFDKEGRSARNVPASFTFATSQYSCGGNYIAENMAENCTCFLTENKCECWCGESETGDDVIIRKML